ncbi:MAG: PDZ domain-containing protein, partial [Promethearchaeia archaeon]
MRERLVTLDANMQRLADEKRRLADEEAALASEEARLQTRQQAHSARKLDMAVGRTSPGATGANQPLAGNPTGWTHATAADSDSANGLEVSARGRRPSDDARMQSEAPPVVRLAVPEYEETLRPWMAVKDVGDLILNRELILGARRRRWTLDLVPGALGILQGLVAGGYEVVLTCKASPEQAAQTLRVLRTIGLVGGAACAVKEEHVVFARSYKDKEVLVQAMGGWACAVDDDWYMLKRAAALGTGMHLVLFNPDPDTEAEYKDDAKKWLAYRQALLAQVSKMGALQLAIRSGNEGMAQAAADELRRVEEAALPQLLHLHDWEPSRISCVPLETVAESALTRMHPATSAVRPWLKVAQELGLADADAFLATLAATDSATPRTNAAGELLGYALHRGRAQAGGGGEPAVPAPKPPVGSVAEAGMFHPVVADPSMTSTTSADDEMGPFFPLDELGGGGEGLSGAAKLRRLGAWEAGLLSSFDRMGVGLDFYIEPTEDLGEGRWALQTIMVSRVMPGGPAARSGAIEKGMALVSVDGVRCDQPAVKAREVLAARLAAFDKSAD